MACKALKINLTDLEPKTFDEFLRQQHEIHYKIGGQRAVEQADVAELAKVQYNYNEKRR